ncbi:tubulin folding cofactor D C terminal domain-containing protein [Phanerochaete sordida]|uniref:Tubulin folding cofactor D C terminal domain-containing protein n=1 Tax=Phanerochaete sordida TaxID=48140 RepID=A0A9P3LJB9_9APHY|nr:tubulin folding cofactor D C terminal domain-containing protein [Phanerochaete sordida]
MIEGQVDDKVFATFDKHDEFAQAQAAFLKLCSSDATEDQRSDADALLKKLSMILDEYQEQAYLLDPFLERLVGPVVEQLKLSVMSVSSSRNVQNPENIGRIAVLLYHYVKFRGHKTITRFFPHEVDDLAIALTFLFDNTELAEDQEQWPLRYIMLLWLSLICMLPFDLAQFDEPENVGKTASDLESVAKSFLGKAGMEREGASILLARLYARQDTNARLPAFLEWATVALKDRDSLFLSVGALQVICDLAKTGSTSQVLPHAPLLLEIARTVESNEMLMGNTLVRKFRIKLLSRVLLRLLPPRRRAAMRGKALMSSTEQADAEEDEEDVDVPDELEDTLGSLFDALQDKDTIVRYSSAKAIARISERLPADFVSQITQQVLALFEIHSLGAAALYDLPALAEATWHGACLACAELARRGLVADAHLPALVAWLARALRFDVRKGAHSVGAAVRDAAAYVLWSLARAQRPAALVPFAEELARTLVTVAVFDREVHIRRAASAAFQEFVGRTSLFPHGIDVLRKTDFYAVGTRRNAFLIAAPEVADHEVYRPALVRHLLTVTLRHWDPAMRRLGASALRAICERDLWTLGPACADDAAQFLDSADTGDIHGALWVLAELAAAYRVHANTDSDAAQRELRKVFAALARLAPAVVHSFRNELVTAAACAVVANSATAADVADAASARLWRGLVDFALKSASALVQEAVAQAMARVSALVDCADYVQRFIRESRTGTPAVQQNACRVLGVLDYNAHDHGLLSAVDFLLASVDKATGLKNVEARRNAFTSLPQIVENALPRLNELLPPETVCAMFDALLTGLEDYTADERGDVGSWVRIACVRGLTSAIELLVGAALRTRDFERYLPSAKFHAAVGGILKQGVERLDNVRQQAGEQLLRLLALPPPARADGERWAVASRPLMQELLTSGEDALDWNDGARLFPKVVRLLAIPEYRHAILSGLVLSVSSRTDSTQRPVSQALVAYARTLPVESAEGYDLRELAADLLAPVRGNLASNNAVIPVLQTFDILLEADAFEDLYEDVEGLKSLRYLLSISSKGVAKFKNVQRVSASMRIVVDLLCVPRLRKASTDTLAVFLGHQYPKVRADTAEHLYMVLQSKDLGTATEDAEDVLLQTEWASADVPAAAAAAARVAQLLADAA